MDADDLLPRDGEHPERVRVAQVVLAREGKLRQIGDVGNLDVAEALAVERDAFLDVGEQCAQPLGLEGAESLARERLDLGLEDHVLILIGAGPRQRRASGSVPLPARETR
jgi:hypothetical protein